MIYTDNSPKHSIYKELQTVHNRMIEKYNLERAAAPDIARAKIMTKYLRIFKGIGEYGNRNNNFFIQTSLEEQAINNIINEVEVELGFKSQTLFRHEHIWYKGGKTDSRNLWGADDVFEAELRTFLNAAAKQAIPKGKIKQSAELVGNLSGNISKGLMQGVEKFLKQKISQEVSGNELISKPEFRSGKVDVISFNGIISSQINPQWREFIKAFQGAKFTVKNYSSKNGNEIIHLGNTNITKSLLGSLKNIVGKDKEAIHIFYHSLAYGEKGNQIVGQHILHLRFIYELTGGGLYDKSGKRIDEADFFIYNDPNSDNIYVRSTKEMIANAIKYMPKVANPLHSDIVILKNAF